MNLFKKFIIIKKSILEFGIFDLDPDSILFDPRFTDDFKVTIKFSD